MPSTSQRVNARAARRPVTCPPPKHCSTLMRFNSRPGPLTLSLSAVSSLVSPQSLHSMRAVAARRREGNAPDLSDSTEAVLPAARARSHIPDAPSLSPCHPCPHRIRPFVRPTSNVLELFFEPLAGREGGEERIRKSLEERIGRLGGRLGVGRLAARRRRRVRVDAVRFLERRLGAVLELLAV